jgi:hypothetical protein
MVVDQGEVDVSFDHRFGLLLVKNLGQLTIEWIIIKPAHILFLIEMQAFCPIDSRLRFLIFERLKLYQSSEACFLFVIKLRLMIKMLLQIDAIFLSFFYDIQHVGRNVVKYCLVRCLKVGLLLLMLICFTIAFH